MKEIDRYELLAELGRGPRGVVYKARDLLTDRIVALKTIDPQLEGRRPANLEAAWFADDAGLAWRLVHPNIVTVYDAGDADGRVYIAMELLKGHDLGRILGAARSPELPRIVKIATGIASGLVFAHEQGVVHRNLKPSNIIVLGGDGLRITDFGITRIGDAVILSGKYARCLGYMSPEQIRGDQAIDGRSDIFSLGIVLYEMLTRRLPFNGSDPAEIMREMSEVEAPLPSELNPRVPPALDGMVLSMLAEDPYDRPPNAAIVLRGLRRLQEEYGEAHGATACSFATLPAAGNAATPAAGAHASGEYPRTPTHRYSTRTSERRRLAGVVTAVLAAAGLSLWWWHAPAQIETRVMAIDAKPSAAMTPTQSPASGSRPPAASMSGEGPMNIASGQAPSTVAEAGSTTTVAGVRSAAAPAAPPAAKITSHAKTANAKQSRARASVPGTATLTVAVSPWGAIYIDGKYHGTTPPVTSFELSPGRHTVEVRNSWQPSYLTYATVRAGEVRRIQHDFEVQRVFN